MIIVDDTYNHNDKLKTGMTSYKIEQVFAKQTDKCLKAILAIFIKMKLKKTHHSS